MINSAPKLQACNFLKTGPFLRSKLHLSADSIFALYKPNRTRKTNIQKGGLIRWSNEFCKQLLLRILALPACRYEGTGSRFVGSQFIFRFDFQVKIFNNLYFMLTRLSAYLHVSGLPMITRVRYGA